MWIRKRNYQELRGKSDALLDEVCSLRGTVTRLEISNKNLAARNETLRKRLQELEVLYNYADNPMCDD